MNERPVADDWRRLLRLNPPTHSHQLNMKRSILSVVQMSSIALASAALSSCILVAEINKSTKGRKLADLKTALDQGAISKSEYKTQREHVLADQ